MWLWNVGSNCCDAFVHSLTMLLKLFLRESWSRGIMISFGDRVLKMFVLYKLNTIGDLSTQHWDLFCALKNHNLCILYLHGRKILQNKSTYTNGLCIGIAHKWNLPWKAYTWQALPVRAAAGWCRPLPGSPGADWRARHLCTSIAESHMVTAERADWCSLTHSTYSP